MHNQRYHTWCHTVRACRCSLQLPPFYSRHDTDWLSDWCTRTLTWLRDHATAVTTTAAESAPQTATQPSVTAPVNTSKGAHVIAAAGRQPPPSQQQQQSSLHWPAGEQRRLACSVGAACMLLQGVRHQPLQAHPPHSANCMLEFPCLPESRGAAYQEIL